VTRQLLAFSRKQLLQPRVFDLNETIAGISRLLARLLGADVEVQTQLAGDALSVIGDPGQVEQAVINLAVNARDAMPGGGRLVLATAFEIVDEAFARSHLPMPPGRYIVLRVSDSGHGMPHETMARIFEPFFTTKDVGKGTGLGLSMVYGTLKQIGASSSSTAIDRGTTSSLYFRPAAVARSRRSASAPGRGPEIVDRRRNGVPAGRVGPSTRRPPCWRAPPRKRSPSRMPTTARSICC
jgi:signal transduction histidine kinase